MVFPHLPEPEEEIFSEKEDSSMDFIEFVESFDKTTQSRRPLSQAVTINDENGLTRHMASQDFMRRVVIVHQPYSWGRLRVSSAMVRSFMRLTNSMRDVWDVVLSFRPQTLDVEQAFSTCAWKSQDSVREICYVFKYPQTKKPVGNSDHLSWVIRQTGVYHQYSLDSDQSTWMLVFPNRESYVFDEVADIMMPEKHPLQPHIDFHFAHMHSWRWYMVDLEKDLQKRAAAVDLEYEYILDFKDMYDQLSDLRLIQRKLSPLVPIFAAHRRVIARLRLMNDELQTCGRVDSKQSSDFVATLDHYEAKLEMLAANVTYLLSHVGNAIQTTSDIISIRSQNATEKMSIHTVGMSTHMVKDSAAIRVITVATLVYLPASFVSGFFGMSFFNLSDGANSEWTVTPYVWVYFLVAVPITALTLFFYTSWKSRTIRNRELHNSNDSVV